VRIETIIDEARSVRESRTLSATSETATRLEKNAINQPA